MARVSLGRPRHPQPTTNDDCVLKLRLAPRLRSTPKTRRLREQASGHVQWLRGLWWQDKIQTRESSRWGRALWKRASSQSR